MATVVTYVGGQKTQWHCMIEYFNECFHAGKLALRKEFVAKFGKQFDRYNSIDSYRCMLCNAGYVQTVQLGVYKPVKEIPANLTLSELRKQAYN